MEEEVYSNSPNGGHFGTPSGSRIQGFSTPIQFCQQPLHSVLTSRRKRLQFQESYIEPFEYSPEARKLSREIPDLKQRLTEAESELDLAQFDNANLKEEVSKLKNELHKQKQLNEKKSESSPTLKCSALHENNENRVEILRQKLRQTVSEHQENEKYLKNLESELQESNEQCSNYQKQYEAMREKLEKRSKENADLTFEVENLRADFDFAQSEIRTYRQRLEELSTEHEQMKSFSLVNKRRQTFGRQDTPVIDGVSVADISVDNPDFSPYKDNGEVIGTNVMLDLQDNISKLTNDLKSEQDKKEELLVKLDILQKDNSQKLDQIESLSSTLQQKSNEFQEFAQRKNQEMCELQSTAQSQESFLHSKITEIQSSYQNKCLEIEQSAHEFQLQKGEFESERQKLNQELESCRLQIQEKGHELQNVLQQMDMFKNQVSNEMHALKQSLDGAMRNNQVLTSEYSTLEQQLKEKSAEAESYLQKMETRERQYQEAIQNRTKKFEEMEATFKKDLEEAETVRAHHKEEIFGLKQLLDGAQKKCESHLSENASIYQKLYEKSFEAEKNLKTLDERTKEYESTIEHKSKQFQEMKKNFDEQTKTMQAQFVAEINAQREYLEVALKKNKALELECAQFSKQLETKSADVDRYIQKMEENAKTHEAEIQHKTKQFQEIEASLRQSYEEQYKSMEAEYVAKSEELSSKISLLEADLLKKQTNERELENIVSNKTKEIEQITLDLGHQVDAKNSELISLKERMTSMEKQFKCEKDEFEQQFSSYSKGMDSKLRELAELIDRLEETLRQRNLEINSSKSQIENLTSALASKEELFSKSEKQSSQEKDKLVADVKETVARLDAISSKNKILEENLQQRDQELGAKVKEIEELALVIAEKEDFVINLAKEKENDLNAKCQEIEDRYNAELQSMKQASDDQILSLESAKNSAIEAAANTHKHQMQELRNEMLLMQQTYDAQKTNLLAKIADMEKEIESLQAALLGEQKLTSEAIELNLKLKTQEKQIEFLHQNLEQCQQEILSKNAEIETMMSEHNEFKQEAFAREQQSKAESDETKFQLENRLKLLQQELEQKIDSRENEIKKLISEHASYMQEAAQREQQVTGEQNETRRKLESELEKVKLLEQNLEECRHEMSTNHATIQKLQNALESKEEYLVQFAEERNQELATKCQDIQSTLSNEIENQKKIFEEQLLALKSAISSKESEMENLDDVHKRKIEDLQSQLECLVSETASQKASSDSNILELQNTIKMLQEDVEERRIAFANSQNVADQDKAFISDKLSVTENSLEAEKQNNIALQEEKQMLANQLKEKIAETEQMSQTLQSKSNDFEKSMNQKSEEFKQLEANLRQEFENQLQETELRCTAQVEEYQSRVTSLEAELLKNLALKNESVQKLSSLEQEAKEGATKLQREMAQIQELRDQYESKCRENDSIAAEIKTKEKETEDLKDKISKLTNKFDEESKKKTEEALKEQKKKYELRLEDLKGSMSVQYRTKLEEGQRYWETQLEGKSKIVEELTKQMEVERAEKNALAKTSSILEEKCKISKEKIQSLASKMEELVTLTSKEKEEVTNKYLAAKETVKKFVQSNQKLQEELNNLQKEYEKQKTELQQVNSQLRSSKVHNIVSDSKILTLEQKERRESTSRPQQQQPPTLAAAKTDSEGFKLPAGFKTANTPGRAKSGRTQSEASMMRRPPLGTGCLFMTDDEAGEMFSSSYLQDLKDGKLGGDINDSGRISELSRRNTLVLPHLKSSYPAETQFRDVKEFADDDLRLSKIPLKVSEDQNNLNYITSKTADLSVDSPAMNTRRRSMTRMIDSPQISWPNDFSILPPPPGKSRKRRSLSCASNVSTDSDCRDQNKRIRRELNMVTYSKPGPPTPARNGNRSINSTTDVSFNNSTNKSFLSANVPTVTVTEETPRKDRNVHDKTPLLDTTNQSTKSSNRSASISMRSAITTPYNLRQAISKAFRKNKDKYDVKGRKGATPAKPKSPFRK